MQTRARVVFTALLLSCAPLASAQSFATPSPPPWKRLAIPCTAAPSFDVTKATAFSITLCSTPATGSVTNAAKADGKLVSFLICQPAAGGKVFVYGPLIYGASPIDPRPGRCSAQTFLVTNSQLWAVAAGTNASDTPPPSLLAPPLSTMSYRNSGGFAAANTSEDVVFSDTIPNGYFKIFAQVGTLTINPVAYFTLQQTFWLENPPADFRSSFGFVFYDGSGDPSHRAQCLYEYGTGTAAINQFRALSFYGHYYNWETPLQFDAPTTDGTQATGAIGSTFLDSSHVVFLKYVYDVSGQSCALSTDNGATWQALAFQPPWLGGGNGWPNYTHVGLVGYIPSTAAKVHLTSIRFSQP